jgi:hypothetical protein
VGCDSAPAGQDDGSGVSPLPAGALGGLGPEAGQAVAQVIGLYREFPAWAVWLPDGGRPWTAVRPASARVPGPELQMTWVSAATAADLAGRMRRADAQLRGDR